MNFFSLFVNCLISLFLIIFFSNPLTAKGFLVKDSFQMISTKEPISHQDWLFFINSEQKYRNKLWQTHQARGILWKDWSWTWKVAWIKACAKENKAWCQYIIEKGLQDKSLYVRARTYASLGLRYQKTKDPKVLRYLAQSYQKKINWRGKRPLFIQKTILKSIAQIGGKLSVQLSKKIIKNQPSMLKYWSFLKKSR